MRVLVCGASGFIGSAICQRLAYAGHTVVRGVRQPTQAGDIAIDYTKDTDSALWRQRLVGIDVVINAVGIIRESRSLRFEDVHHQAPVALFTACVEAGVKRVIQISALGAVDGQVPYFTSKYAADQTLMRLPISWQILRPSLVYGAAGDSALMFCMFSSLPIIPVPALGNVLFQPIHIDDLTEGVERAIEPGRAAGQQIDMVGASAVTYRAMLASYRQAMDFASPLYMPIPAWIMRGAARLALWIPESKLTPDNWRMLTVGNAGNVLETTDLLGHSPKAIDQFMSADSAAFMRYRALAEWRIPLLRYTLALLWMMTACISAFIYPVSESLLLLQRVGLTGGFAMAVFYFSVILDFVMGFACIKYPGRALWAAQAVLVVAYSLIIVLTMPEFLSHPFGPIIKNLPILAILVILFSESKS